jgi:tRNA (guanine-N7-)-methyltransferase
MEPKPRRLINKTTDLRHQTEYTRALNGECAHVAFDEQRAPLNKGRWRSQVFQAAENLPMDLEIGTGNGLHFAHHSSQHPERLVVGVELKYKPLIQSIRRALRGGARNAAIARYHAFNLDELFAEGELNNVFIHFPDPWVTPRKPKNRFVAKDNLDLLYRLQRPGSYIDFKTDSREYHLWALDEIKQSKYKIVFETQNLHQSEMNAENFLTQFEKIFMKQGIEINFVRLLKES